MDTPGVSMRRQTSPGGPAATGSESRVCATVGASCAKAGESVTIHPITTRTLGVKASILGPHGDARSSSLNLRSLRSARNASVTGKQRPGNVYCDAAHITEGRQRLVSLSGGHQQLRFANPIPSVGHD